MNEPQLLITNAAEAQRIRNARAEGILILRAGTKSGRSVAELIAIRRHVEKLSAQLGESRIKGATIGWTMTDVTPAGYGA